jgi:signal transduction histidine kinase
MELERGWDDEQLVTQIRVVDTGIGIQPEDQEKLFQAFSQVESSAARPSEGTGLGLYLSQSLAALLGGRLTFTSEYGKGSVFTVTFSERRERSAGA